MLMKWKSLFAAALTAAVALPALAQDATGGGSTSDSTDGTVISLSFANGRADQSEIINVSEGETAVGLAPVPGNQWTNLSQAGVTNSNRTISVTDAEVSAAYDCATSTPVTLPVPVKVSFSAANGWSILGKQSSPAAPSILHAYLDDGSNGASVTVKDIPFSSYDVIVYFATDNEKWTNTNGEEGSDGSMQFQPVTVNNTLYSWQNGALVSGNAATNVLFGQSLQDTVAEGTNALRIPNLSGATLTIQGGTGFIDGNYKKGRGCIAAVQIVQAADGALRTPSISVNMKGGVGSIVRTDGDSGLLSVPNANWNELQTSAASGGSETIGALRDAAGKTTSLSIGATYAGGAWSQPSAGRNTLGDMANGYRDTKQLTLNAVPYSSYDLILYFGSDLNGDIAKPWTPVQVTDVNGASKWYSYPADYTVPKNGAAQAADANPGDWGTTADCHTAATAVAYGKAVMKIAGLSGDVTLSFPRNTDGNDSTNRSGLYGFQIVCTGEEIVPPPPSINVNFADVMTPDAQGGTLSNPDADIPATAGTYGLAPAPGNTWANLRPATTGTDGTETVTTAYACVLDTPVRVSYKASGTYEYTGFAEAPVDAVLRYYLDDGTSQLNGTADGVQRAGADIYVTNIPFSKYDAIVYLATDNGEVFTPVEINGKLYKGAKSGAEEALLATDTWGTAKQTTPALGVNALRVSGLKGNLRIKGGTRQNKEDGKTAYARSGIAAFQIVLADDGEILETVDPDRGVLSLNFNSNRNDNPGYNAVPDTDDFYGLDAVPGKAWYDSSAEYGDKGSSAIDNTEFVNVAYGPVLKTNPKVTISAANGYGYSSSDPFMRAYLDDNARVNISSEVPYDYYDVIVYSATNDTNSRFQAVGVNGTDYRWRDDQGKPVVAGVGELFGYGGRDAAFGQNAQRINGQTANPLTIAPRERNASYRGGIAAIQIIERPVQEIKVDTSMTAQQVFAQALPGRVPKLVFVEGGTITGAVNLSGVAVDLTQFTTSPFTGNLTVDANTKLYLPAGTRTYPLTTGTVAGTLAAANVFIGDMAIPADAMTQDGANLTFDIEVTYNWTGAAGDNLWSTPANWSGNAVPKADSEVTVSLNANDAKTIVIDTAEATANLFYISGPSSGSATLEIVAAEGVQDPMLVVADKMLTTGNVTVTQKANIDVAGTSQMGDGSSIPANQVVQAGFQVNGSRATYTVESGALVVQEPDTGAGDVSVSNGATLEVSAGGTLTAARVVVSYYGNATSAASGTLSIAGTATFSTQVAFRNDGLTMELAGGTLTTPSVRTFHGLTVSVDSTLAALDGQTMTVSGTNSALSGEGNLTLQGAVTFSSAITADYTGELTADAGSTVTLGENRPKLSVVSGTTVSGTTVLITPTTAELAEGSISFATSMTAVPNKVTFTVDGVEAVNPEVENGQLTLAWEVSLPTISATTSWNKADSWSTGSVPTSGTVVLDGTAEGGITVTLDTAIPEEITSIILRGDVTLVTFGAQSTIPACVTPAEGAVLTIGANISGASLQSPWELPAGTTLKVTKGFTSFAYLTLNGAVEIAEGVTGSIEAPSAFDGGLTVNASGVTLTGATNVGVTLALNGDNIVIQGSEGSTFYTDNGTTVVNKGTGNAITVVTGLSGAVTVESGTLRLTLQNKLNNAFPGATIAEGATLTLAGPNNSQEWWFPATGAGTLVLEDAIRPMFAAVSGSPTLPKKMVFTATEAEQAAGVISCLNWKNGATIPEGFSVTVNPAEGGGAWVPNAVLEAGGNSYLRIYNVPAPNGLTGLDDAVALALRQAAAKEGITNGNYTVQLRTKGGQTTIASPDAAALNDVLGCFTDLKATAEGTTLTYAYDFGIVGIKRNTTGDGWVVTAKVQGEGAAPAGFAKGNAYVLSVTAGGTEKKVQLTGESGVDETSAATGTVELTVPDTLLEGVGDGFTLGVSVSRNAPEL